MKLFLDTHKKVDGLTAEAVTGAHAMDLAVQEKYGVKYLRTVQRRHGQVSCLVEALNAAVARRCTERTDSWQTI
jgi:hypothetical protein